MDYNEVAYKHCLWPLGREQKLIFEPLIWSGCPVSTGRSSSITCGHAVVAENEQLLAAYEDTHSSSTRFADPLEFR